MPCVLPAISYQPYLAPVTAHGVREPRREGVDLLKTWTDGPIGTVVTRHLGKSEQFCLLDNTLLHNRPARHPRHTFSIQ